MDKDGTQRISQVLILCLLITLILLIRRPDSFFQPQLWAEDATIFLKQQVEDGASAVFKPYAGYLNLGSRLIALMGANVRFLYIPTFYNFCSLLVLLGCASIIAQCRLPLPSGCKYLMALALVLIPHGGEVFLNLTNLQWILASLLPILLIQPSGHRPALFYLELVLVVIIGFTGPFLVLFSPLLIYRWFIYNNFRSNLFITAICIPPVAIQTYLISTSPELKQSLPTAELQQWLQAFGNFSNGLLLGNQLPQYLPLSISLLLLLLFGIATAFAVYKIKLVDPERFPFCLAVIFASIAVYVVSLIKFENSPSIIHALGNGQRYFYLPYLFISWLLLVFVFVHSRNFIRKVGLLGLMLMLLSTATAFPIQPMQNFHWSKYAKQLDQGKVVKAPINPPGWFVKISPNK